MEGLFLKRLQGEQTEHHLPEGGNSFQSAKQSKQPLHKVWSSKGTAHSGVSTGSIKDVILTTDTGKSHLHYDLTVNGASYGKQESLSYSRKRHKSLIMPPACMTQLVNLTQECVVIGNIILI